MSEQPTNPDQQAAAERFDSEAERRWADALETLSGKSFQGTTPEEADTLKREFLEKFEGLRSAPELKFNEYIDEAGNSYKTLERPSAETPSDGLPVGEVMSLLGAEGAEFEAGVPDPEKNSDYLQRISDYTGKPLTAHVMGEDGALKPPIEVVPSETQQPPLAA